MNKDETDGLKILINQVKCTLCMSAPFSRHVHDYVECACGNVAVDGGMVYQRIVYTADASTYEDMTVTMPKRDFNKLKALLIDPLINKDMEMCCDIYINYMKYPNSIKSILMPAAVWCVKTRRNAIGLICAFARAQRDGKFE